MALASTVAWGADPTSASLRYIARALLVGMIDIHTRQVPYLPLGDAEPDAVLDPAHGLDGDGHFPASPHVTFLEKDMGHVAIVRVDDQPLDSPDISVCGVHRLAAAQGHVASGTLSTTRGCASPAPTPTPVLMPRL